MHTERFNLTLTHQAKMRRAVANLTHIQTVAATRTMLASANSMMYNCCCQTKCQHHTATAEHPQPGREAPPWHWLPAALNIALGVTMGITAPWDSVLLCIQILCIVLLQDA